MASGAGQASTEDLEALCSRGDKTSGGGILPGSPNPRNLPTLSSPCDLTSGSFQHCLGNSTYAYLSSSFSAHVLDWLCSYLSSCSLLLKIYLLSSRLLPSPPCPSSLSSRTPLLCLWQSQETPRHDSACPATCGNDPHTFV